MQTFEHNLSGKNIIGTRLVPNSVLEPTDMYNSTSGTWEAAGSMHAGGKVPAGDHVYWVRPAKETKAA